MRAFRPRVSSVTHTLHIASHPTHRAAGAGPAIFVIDRGRFQDNEVDVGANLLFGLGAGHGRVRPYGQFKAILMDDPEAAIAFGLRFQRGRTHGTRTGRADIVGPPLRRCHQLPAD